MFNIENVLDGIKDLLSILTLVDIIVFRSDVDDELEAIVFGALCDSLDLLNIYFSLNSVFLNVVKGSVCKE